MIFACYGHNTMLGHDDMAQARNYQYSLRTKSRDTSVYLIHKRDFISQVLNNERSMKFRQFCFDT